MEATTIAVLLMTALVGGVLTWMAIKSSRSSPEVEAGPGQILDTTPEETATSTTSQPPGPARRPGYKRRRRLL